MAASLLSLIKILCGVGMIIVLGRMVWQATAQRGGIGAIIPGLIALAVLGIIPTVAGKLLATKAPETADSTFACTIFDSTQTGYKFTNNEGGLNTQYKLAPSDASAIVNEFVGMGTAIANGLWEGMNAIYLPAIITAVAIVVAVWAFIQSQNVVQLIFHISVICLLWSLVVGSVNQKFPRAMLSLANTTVTAVSRAMMVNLTTWAEGKRQQTATPDMWSDMHLQMAVESASLPASTNAIIRALIVQSETSAAARKVRDEGYFSPNAFALLQNDIVTTIVDPNVPMLKFNARIGGGGFATNTVETQEIPAPIAQYYAAIMAPANQASTYPIYKKGASAYPWHTETPTIYYLGNPSTQAAFGSGGPNGASEYAKIKSDVAAFYQRYFTTKDGDFIFTTNSTIDSLQQQASSNKYMAEIIRRSAHKVTIGIMPLGKKSDGTQKSYEGAFEDAYNKALKNWQANQERRIENDIAADNTLSSSESQAQAYRSTQSGLISMARAAIIAPPRIIWMPTMPIQDHLDAMYADRDKGILMVARTGPSCADILVNKDATNPNAFGCLLGTLVHGVPAGVNLGGTARIGKFFKDYAVSNNSPGQGAGLLSPASGLTMAPAIFASSQPGGTIINPEEKKSLIAKIIGWCAAGIEFLASGYLYLKFQVTGKILMYSAMIAAPVIVGAALMFITGLWPVIAVASLWPGRWAVILDWVKATLWVMSWAPVCFLGAWMWDNADVWGGLGARSLTLKYIQLNIAALVIISGPMVTKVILSPSVDGLAGVAGPLVKTVATSVGAVTGTMIAIGAAIVTAGAGAAAGAAAAGAGASAGAGGAATGAAGASTRSAIGSQATTGGSVASRAGGKSALSGLGTSMRGMMQAGQQRATNAIDALVSPGGGTGGQRLESAMQTFGKSSGQGGLSRMSNDLVGQLGQALGKEVDSLTRTDDGRSHADRMSEAMGSMAAGDVHGADQALHTRPTPKEQSGGSAGAQGQPTGEPKKPGAPAAPPTAKEAAAAVSNQDPASALKTVGDLGHMAGDASTETAGQIADAASAIGEQAQARARGETSPIGQAQWSSVAAQAHHTAAAARAKQAQGLSGAAAAKAVGQAERHQAEGDAAAGAAAGAAALSGTGSSGSVAISLSISQAQTQAIAQVSGTKAPDLVQQMGSARHGDEVVRTLGDRLQPIIGQEPIAGRPLGVVVEEARQRIRQGESWDIVANDLHHTLRTHVLGQIKPDDEQSATVARERVNQVDKAVAGSIGAVGARIAAGIHHDPAFAVVATPDQGRDSVRLIGERLPEQLAARAPTLSPHVPVAAIMGQASERLEAGEHPAAVLRSVHQDLRHALIAAAVKNPEAPAGEARYGAQAIDACMTQTMSQVTQQSIPANWLPESFHRGGEEPSDPRKVGMAVAVGRILEQGQDRPHVDTSPLADPGSTASLRLALNTPDTEQRIRQLEAIEQVGSPAMASAARFLKLSDPEYRAQRLETAPSSLAAFTMPPSAERERNQALDDFLQQSPPAPVRAAVMLASSTSVQERADAAGDLALADAMVYVRDNRPIPEPLLADLGRSQFSPQAAIAAQAELHRTVDSETATCRTASTPIERRIASSRIRVATSFLALIDKRQAVREKAMA